MTDWKKISLILGSMVALTVVASFSYRVIGKGYELETNSANIPKVIEKLDQHIISDNRKATIDSMRNIQFMNALTGLAGNVKELNETVKENTRAMRFDEFNRRK